MEPKRTRWPLVVLGILAAAAAIASTVLAIKWPFTRAAIIKTLQKQAEGEVTIREFHKVFFPHPGCIARGVVIHHGPDTAAPPLITAEQISATSDWTALLTFSKRVREIRTDGMHIRIPADRHSSASSERESSDGSTQIARFVAENAILEFASKDPRDEPFVIQIHRTVLEPASSKAAMNFETTLRIPEPPGEVVSKGKFGPWNKNAPYHTAVSGTYRFEQANLGKFHGLSGILASTGRYEGTVDHIAVSGDTDVPAFEIDGGQRMHLKTGFRAVVNGQTGDVGLDDVDARFLRTTVVSAGSVAAPADGEPKVVRLDMSVRDGRVQDVLRLVGSGPPGLLGTASVRFKVTLPPGERKFLERVRVTGDIGIGGAKFTNPSTQGSLEHISANAQDGEDDPEKVVSDLKGHVNVANGVATLTGISFRVPGAWADMSGTYNLITKRVDLSGTVHLEEKLSQTTHGIKSFLLKPLDPFFKKKKHLSVVPVKITGSYGHTSIGLKL